MENYAGVGAATVTEMNRTVQALCFLIVAIVFILHAVYLGAVAEDSYISFRYAKNLASGNRLVWDVSDPPVEGYSSFPWVVISAAALHAGFDVGSFAQVVGIIAGLVCLAYSYLYCRRLLGLGPGLSLLPCAYLAVAGPFATWATSGMETNLFAMLVLSSTYYMVAYWCRGKVLTLGLGFLLATLATLTRPEGFGVFCVLLGMHCLRAIIQGGAREFTKGILTAAVFYLLPFAVYFVWRLGYYGSMLPNAFYAKIGGTVCQWFRGVQYLFWFGLHFVCPVILLLTAIAWEAVRRRRTARSATHLAMAKNWVTGYYGAVVPLGLCLCCSGYIVLVGGDYMAMYRFFFPILPLAYVLLAHGASVLYVEARAFSLRSKLAAALVILGALGTFLHSTPLELYLLAKPYITHGQYRGVLTERRHSQRLSLIGRFFKDYKRSEAESLATGAIGAISYYSDLHIYGFHGIVDPHIAHQKPRDLGKGFPGHEKHDYAYILENKPTYFMFTRNLEEKPCDFPSEDPPDITALLRRDYEVVARWLEDKDNGESGYFCFLQRKSDAER